MDTVKSCLSCRFVATSPNPCGDCVTSPSLPKWEAPVSATHTVLVDGRPEPSLKGAPIFPPADPMRGAVIARTDAPKDTNPKTRYGMAKPPLALIPAAAEVQVSMAFADGARKYGPGNWRVDPVSASTYLNAARRHISSWQDGETNASDSGVHHLAHAAACLMILLDAEVASSLIDDRPPPCPTSDLIKRLTKAID